MCYIRKLSVFRSKSQQLMQNDAKYKSHEEELHVDRSVLTLIWVGDNFS